MQDGEFVLRESAAIVSYLADKYRGRGAIDLAPAPGTQVPTCPRAHHRTDRFMSSHHPEGARAVRLLDALRHDRDRRAESVHTPQACWPPRGVRPRARRRGEREDVFRQGRRCAVTPPRGQRPLDDGGKFLGRGYRAGLLPGVGACHRVVPYPRPHAAGI